MEVWYQRGIDIGEIPVRMLREKMAAAGLAPLAKAPGCLLVGSNLAGAFRDSYGVGLPQCKGVDGSRGPVTTGFTVAIAHRLRFAGYRDLYSSAEAVTPKNVGLVHVSPQATIAATRRPMRSPNSLFH